MDTLLLSTLIIVSFVGNFLLLRYFIKRLSDKISHLIATIPESFDASSASIPDPVLPQSHPVAFDATSFPNQTGYAVSGTTIPNDPPSANQAAQSDVNDLELNEQNLTGLPADVRFEVEGGDSTVPPGFEEKK